MNRVQSHAGLCVALFVLSFFLCWSFGGIEAYPWELLHPSHQSQSYILLFIRLPRIVCACLVGAALGAAGVLTQGLFRNPLASPSLLGISSGGVLGACLALFLGFESWNNWLHPLCAFLGCFLSLLCVLSMSRRIQAYATEDLLLIGFALNGILSAASSLLLSIALHEPNKSASIMNWMLGTLSGKTWNHNMFAVLPIAIALLAAWRLAYPLNVLALGAENACSVGLNIATVRRQGMLVIALLVTVSVTLGGLLPFVGLIVPHVSRLLVGPDHRKLLPLSALNGATLVMSSDLVARTLIAPLEIQVGALISLFGSPFFLWLYFQERRKTQR